jgi:hypothetical protein
MSRWMRRTRPFVSGATVLLLAFVADFLLRHAKRRLQPVMLQGIVADGQHRQADRHAPEK